MNKEQLEQFDVLFNRHYAEASDKDIKAARLKTYSSALSLHTRLENLGYTTTLYQFSEIVPACIEFTVRLEDWKVIYLVNPAQWLLKTDTEIHTHFTNALESMKEHNGN